MGFLDLGLSSAIITASGYLSPTAVQKSVIPIVLKGKDVMACAATGTGKTAAFALPILEQLISVIDNKQLNPTVHGRNPKVLVLTPTRELAQQVSASFISYSKTTDLAILAVFGGANISPQRKDIAKGVDVLVATPGRLFDLLGQDWLSLNNIDYLVVDEADRMLDLGFVKDIQKVKRLLPEVHQSLFFSATYSESVKKLAETLLKNPVWVDVENTQDKPDIEQTFYLVDRRRKAELIAELTGKNNWQQVIVFVNAKETADKLSKELKLDGIKAVSLHGDKTQGARNKALLDIKQGKLQIIVATDLAARGLDIEALPLVINFELPEELEDYVHRIGRTGRAGMKGHAISLVSPSDRSQIKSLEFLMKDSFATEIINGYELGAPLPERYRQQEVAAAKKSNSRQHKRNFKSKSSKGSANSSKKLT